METTPLGRYVREKREGAGLSVTALADATGLTKSEISAIERGRIALPGAAKRRALASALRVRHVDILEAAGELREDEIPVQGEPEPLFAPNDPRGSILAAVIKLPSHGSKEFYRTIATMISAVASQANEGSQ